MKKKLISAILVAAMCVGTLAGCGGGGAVSYTHLDVYKRQM